MAISPRKSPLGWREGGEVIGHQKVGRGEERALFLEPPLCPSFPSCPAPPPSPLSSPQFRLLCFALFTNCPLKFRRKEDSAAVDEKEPEPPEEKNPRFASRGWTD